MIVGRAFPGDANRPLALLQHDTYWEHVSFLFREAKERYVRAVHLIGIETELYQRIRDRTCFDHRVLRAAHDSIAGYYRFEHDNGGQMPLPFEDLSCEDALRRSWHQWFRAEVRDAVDHSNAITLAILAADAHQNSKPGYAAENHLATLLLNRYGNLMQKALERQAKAREKWECENQGIEVTPNA